jgi:predicted hydrocarbon binding protein
MRFVKISTDDLIKIRKLYEGLMSHACHGLFFREGLELGQEYSESATESGGEYFSAIKNILKFRGWVKDISFNRKNIIVEGSAESNPDHDVETCHRLRGILHKVIEIHYLRKIKTIETECESLGNERCIFNYEFVEIEDEIGEEL